MCLILARKTKISKCQAAEFSFLKTGQISLSLSVMKIKVYFNVLIIAKV